MKLPTYLNMLLLCVSTSHLCYAASEYEVCRVKVEISETRKSPGQYPKIIGGNYSKVRDISVNTDKTYKKTIKVELGDDSDYTVTSEMNGQGDIKRFLVVSESIELDSFWSFMSSVEKNIMPGSYDIDDEKCRKIKPIDLSSRLKVLQGPKW